MITHSATLIGAFFVGGGALETLGDAVLTDAAALENLHSTLGAVEANLALEGGARWDAAVLRGQVETLGRYALADARDPAKVRQTLQNIVAGMEHLPQSARDRAFERTRRVLTLFDKTAAAADPQALYQLVSAQNRPTTETDQGIRLLIAGFDTYRHAHFYLALLVENHRNLFTPDHVAAMRGKADELSRRAEAKKAGEEWHRLSLYADELEGILLMLAPR